MARQFTYTFSESAKKRARPDSTQSWVVAGACFLVTLVLGGLNRSKGILFAHYVQQSGLNRELASWPFNVFGAAVILAPLTGILTAYLSVRVIFVLGILMNSAGIALCYFSIDVYFMIVFYGIIRGLGVTLAVTLIPVLISSYFMRHRATAQGIASAGGAFGTMVFSYLIEFFLDEYSLRGTMLLIGGIALHGLIGAMLMEKPPWTKIRSSQSKITFRSEISTIYEPDPPPIPHKEKKPIKQDPDETVYRRFLAIVLNPIYIVIVVSYIFSANFSMFYMLVITDYAKDMNLSEGVLLLTVYSTGELFGRIGLGWITDRKLIGRRSYLVVSYLVTGLVGGTIPFSRILAVHLASAAVLGLSQGSNLSVSMAVLGDEMRKDRMHLAVGLLRSVNGLAALTRSPVLGFFRDRLGSYDYLFHTLGGLIVVGAILWTLLFFVSLFNKHFPSSASPILSVGSS